MDNLLRDPVKAPSGHDKIDWVQLRMPVLERIRARFEAEKPLAGTKIALCLHLEAKTAYLAVTLKAAGAEVAITGSNPLSTQDDVAAALAERGVAVYAWHGATAEEYNDHLRRTLAFGPQLVLDDGGDLVAMLHTSMRKLLPGVIGGCEETTTGVMRLRAMAADGALTFPMLAVNDARSKFLFDNRYGTGQSVWDGIMRTTNLVVAGKRVVVVGYGWCGKGVAMRAKGLGARVTVCEVDPVRALEALMDGYDVMSLAQAASEGDFFVTVTGCRDAIRQEHFQVMKDGVVLANAGHFDVEIGKKALEQLAVGKRRVRPCIDAYDMPDGRQLFLLGEGRLVNLACGDGHPAEIMDMSFAVQALGMEYLVENGRDLAPGVHDVNEILDRAVATEKLRALGIKIDSLSSEQEQYLSSWEGV